MRLGDFFFLSVKYISTHKARFFVTLTAVTLLFTVLACFTCAYLSGEATFNKCIEEDFAKNGLVCTPYGLDGAQEHGLLISALNDAFGDNFVIRDTADISVTGTSVNGMDYPVPLFYYVPYGDIEETITEGEEYDPSATGKIWLPRLNTFGQYELHVGDVLPLSLTVSGGEKYEISPRIAGFHSGSNSVFISPAYAFAEDIPVSIPEITFTPRELSFEQVGEIKVRTESIFSDIYGDNFTGAHFSSDGYFEEFSGAVKTNTVIFAIAAIALAAFGFVSLANSLMMGITENSATLSLYKTLGLKNSGLLALLCFEAVTLILLSVALASLLAFALLPVSAYAGDFLWGGTLSVFGEFTVIAPLPAWLPFALAGILSVAAILTTMIFFRKNGKKYVQAGLREGGL